jgi:hypothetical protein
MAGEPKRFVFRIKTVARIFPEEHAPYAYRPCRFPRQAVAPEEPPAETPVATEAPSPAASPTKRPPNRRNGHSRKTVRGDMGELTIATPRDRNGTFEPQLIGKHQRRVPGFDEKILALYAKGMTTRDIQEIVREMYDVEVSATLISEPNVGAPENGSESLASHRPDPEAVPDDLRESGTVVAILAVGGHGLCPDLPRSVRRRRSLTMLRICPVISETVLCARVSPRPEADSTPERRPPSPQRMRAGTAARVWHLRKPRPPGTINHRRPSANGTRSLWGDRVDR